MSKQSRLNRKFDRIKRLEESGELKRRKQGNRALRKLLNNRLAIVGGAIFLVILISCIFAPFLASHSPTAVDMKAILKMPSGNHPFGTDKLGRDVFARVLYGGRMSIAIGFGSALGCAVIGVLAGCYSGYRGGRFDQFMVRISEIFMSIPQLILVLMLVSILGQSAKNIV
ncbi:ABC transporter permease, partial [Longicatena caecimuris]